MVTGQRLARKRTSFCPASFPFGSICLAVLFSLLLVGRTEGASNNVSFPDTVGTVATQFRTILENQILQKLPASVGDCTADTPPTPCKETGLLYEDKNSAYRAYAYWVGGLNTFKLEDSQVIPPAATSDGATSTAPSTLRATATFQELPLNLRAEACVPFTGACAAVADGTDYCCQGPVKFTIDIVMGCSPSSPHLTSLKVEKVTITPDLVIKKTIAGIDLKIKDITKNVEDAVKDALNRALTDSNAPEDLNSVLTPLFEGSTVVCNSLQDNPPSQDPAPTPSSSSPRPTTTASLSLISALLSFVSFGNVLLFSIC